MIGEIARRFRALTPAQQRRWALMAPIGLASAALEGLGGLVVFALLALLFDPAGAADGRIVSAIRSFLPASTTSSTLVGLAALAAAIHIARNLIAAALTWWRAHTVELDTAALCTRLLRGHLSAPWTAHMRRSSAAVMETLHGSARSYFDVLESASTIVTEAAVIAALGLVALAVAPAGVSAIAAVVAILLWLVTRFARDAQRRGGERSAELGTALYRHVQHSLGALKELIILGRSHYFADAFERDAYLRARLDTRRALIDALPRLLIESAFVLGMFALVVAATASGSTATVLPIVSLYAYAGFRVIPAVHRIAIQTNGLRWTIGASATLLDDLETGTPAASAQPTRPARIAFQRELKAEALSFAYEGAGRPVLLNVNATIRYGESVAIVGATGAGKTTLVDVLIGLLPPVTGRVTVDGEPIAANIQGWQQNIGYVPQMPFLIDDTLRRNIALGIPDDLIDEQAVAQAVELARLSDTVRQMPDGLSTTIGEIGVRLSGGERQRVSIARALYRNPSLLVFDEATASLDPGTERDIVEAIEPLRGGRTVVIIAHRMTTVARCDRILLLSGGRIEAEGTYHELVERSAAFRAVAAL